MKNYKNNIIKSKCYDIFNKAIDNYIFPGAAIAVAWGLPEKRRRIIQTYGYTNYSQKNKVENNTIYDLASLTKPFATSLSILALLKEGQIKLSTSVSDIFPQIEDSFWGKISIQNLLCHSSGLPAHRPYYLELTDLAEKKRRDAFFKLLTKESLIYKTGSTSVYSDLGFMLLGMIIEKISGIDLAVFFKKKIAEPLGLAKKIFYKPIEPDKQKSEKNNNYAPTEECPFRKKLLYGEVSDENAYILGGVAGHAGLFGSIEGVLKMGEHLLEQWQGREEHPSYLASDLCYFLKKQDIPDSTWALGFDTPSSINSSGGKYLASTSVGHLGFTGTSFWIDPTRELVMILLSNRVHPSRDNNRIKQFRPFFHDTVLEGLGLV